MGTSPGVGSSGTSVWRTCGPRWRRTERPSSETGATGPRTGLRGASSQGPAPLSEDSPAAVDPASGVSMAGNVEERKAAAAISAACQPDQLTAAGWGAATGQQTPIQTTTAARITAATAAVAAVVVTAGRTASPSRSSIRRASHSGRGTQAAVGTPQNCRQRGGRVRKRAALAWSELIRSHLISLPNG